MLQPNRGKFKMFNDRTAKFLLLAALVICVGGAFAPNWIVNQFMFGFSRALAILGLMVLWRTGLVSFGHAFYFGLGAYAVAILDSKLGVSDVFLRLMAGAVVAGVAGFLIGFIMRNYRDIFFRDAQHSDIDGAVWHCGKNRILGIDGWLCDLGVNHIWAFARDKISIVRDHHTCRFNSSTCGEFLSENDLWKTDHRDQRQ